MSAINGVADNPKLPTVESVVRPQSEVAAAATGAKIADRVEIRGFSAQEIELPYSMPKRAPVKPSEEKTPEPEAKPLEFPYTSPTPLSTRFDMSHPVKEAEEPEVQHVDMKG